MTTPTIEIRPIPASGPGALDGFGGECSVCGMQIASSLKTLAVTDVQRHIEWHTEQGR